MYDAEVMEFYLHKVAVIPCLPTGVILILLASGLVFRRWWLIGVALSVFVLGSMPVVAGYLQYYVERGAVRIKVMEAPRVDAIVVLSGGSIDRRNTGIALYRAGKAPLLLFTGGWSPWSPYRPLEGDVSIRFALDQGLPRESLRTTKRVLNTEGEAEAVAMELQKLMASEQTSKPRVLLVTSAAHMMRAQIIFSNVGMHVAPFPLGVAEQKPVLRGFIDFLPTAGAFAQTEGAWRESCGQLVYWVKGFFMDKFQANQKS